MSTKTNIKKNSSVFLVTAFLSFFFPIPAWSEGVGPFGFDVGKDQFEDIKGRLDGYGCDYSKTTAITSGKIAVCPSGKFDLKELTNDVLFVFSYDGVLEAVSMNVSIYSLSEVKPIYLNLCSKYRLIKTNIPQGDLSLPSHAYLNAEFQSAPYSNENVNLLLDYDYTRMSGEGKMHLMYSTDRFREKHKSYTERLQQEKDAKQKGQL